MEPQYNPADNTPDEGHSSIFPALNEMDRQEYERGIRKARNALFFVGGLMFAVDMIMLAVQRDAMSSEEVLVTVALDAVMLVAFLALGFWSKRKPYTALLAGLILFCTIQVLAMIGDPSNIYKGILVKVFVIAALISGIKKAKQLQEMTRLHGQ